MNRIVTAALVAAATTAASWALNRWLDGQARSRLRTPRRPLDTWEDEGGALAPHHAAVETSQVPR